MLQKILLPIIVFIIVLIGLTFGEGVFTALAVWLHDITGLVIYNFSDLYYTVSEYVSRHPVKILVALVVTAIVCIWIYKNKDEELTRQASSRKIAIFLAIFLGWLGAHRFYNGQIGMGLLYLIISFIWLPLTVFLSLIDAVRYIFMNDEEYRLRIQSS
ncbi:MAG: TM2 domain-containing protein [Advenella sp.]|jgi:hypothetical protein|uniref:TM2 domain-containing protein n=2 Tax=Advenella TaxID=290425 RepID=A0A4Q7V8Z7_9BURK|nr:MULTISPECIES: TM2 domain-containing protein [Advenella]AFK63079.1 TM2 domain-containing protein [Advenella kashmirensis WT001]RZT91990.1 TM2 domain-containing protein [Advenella incenata]